MKQNIIGTILFYLILDVVNSAEIHSLITHGQSRNKRNEDDQLSISDSCSTPTIENGNVNIGKRTVGPGESVINTGSILISCNQNYALYHPQDIERNICEDGNWTYSMPTCKPTCPPLISTTLDIICTLNNKTVSCSKPVLEDTEAKGKCKKYYISAHTYSAISIITCKGGYWDRSFTECVPDCGEGISVGGTNVVSGIDAIFGEFPWHVGIYRLENGKYTYKCGGSIIHSSLVISAAHCFINKYQKINPANEYYIAAGKYYSAYDSEDDILAQKSQVQEYHFPAYYNGAESNHQADLAVLVLETKFNFSEQIRPVCMDLNKEFERDQLLAGSMGSVVGWGYEDPNIEIASKSLKKLTVPYVEISRCLTEVPMTFKKWVTEDKFCAGFRNGSSVCKGDSGGGMVFPWESNNKIKYYLRGVVSVGPLNNTKCDNTHYGVYTQITHFSDFIQNIMAKHIKVTTTKTCTSAKYGSCKIPKIENGSFSFLDNNIAEGNSVPNYGYIQINCNKNFTLYPNNQFLNCLNSSLHIPIPHCKQTCPPLMSPFAKNIICSIDDKTVQCTEPVVDGAVAQITCNDGSEIFTKCAARSWDKPDPFRKCKPDLLACNNENSVNCTTLTTEKINTVQPPLSNGSCPLPEIKNGKYDLILHKDEQQLVYAPNYSPLRIICNDNYTLYPIHSDVIICIDGVWNQKVPECKRTCRPLISDIVDVTCTVDEKTVECTKPLVEGTKARSKCKKHYKMSDLSAISTIRCFEGSWDSPLIQCEPDCGIPGDNTITINGETVETSEFPWHAAVYRLDLEDDKYVYRCGATIITVSAVISTKGCIYNGKKPSHEFYIGAGKYYNAYNASEDVLAQTRKVINYYIPPQAQSIENYNFSAADICVIFVEKPFQLTDVVLPVCLDFGGSFEREQLTPNSIGTIVGWGYTEPSVKQHSKVLKKINAPFQNFETCVKDFPQYYSKWVTTDKFCAGYINGSNHLCQGDHGGGLVFPWTVNNQVKYYLRGVLTGGPLNNGTCSFYQRTLYIQISIYSDFIVNTLKNNTGI